MINQDLVTGLDYVVASNIAAVSDNTAVTSAVVDMQDAMGLSFVVVTGALADADATFAIKLQHGDLADGSDAVDVAAGDQIGATAFTFADDNKAFDIGYLGYKRYVRAVVTPSGNAASATLGILAVKRPQKRGAFA